MTLPPEVKRSTTATPWVSLAFGDDLEEDVGATVEPHDAELADTGRSIQVRREVLP